MILKNLLKHYVFFSIVMHTSSGIYKVKFETLLVLPQKLRESTSYKLDTLQVTSHRLTVLHYRL
jgi:hypothetical protein